MFNIFRLRRPKISVVVVFYNMQREARRTLHTLTCNYQKNVRQDDYEVLVVDSNSTEPLDKKWVESLQPNFSYHFVESNWPTPCRAMNHGIGLARADHVVCMIDGARMLSPGLLDKVIMANSLFSHSCVQTIAMHLGPRLQNESLMEGYNQAVEDDLLSTVDWKSNGYSLFSISTLAMSSARGFSGPLSESNCFSLPTKILKELGGLDENFTSPGGGLVNHDILFRALSNEDLKPIILLGEASFHQFHGGVATNVSLENHPSETFLKEYQRLRKTPFNHHPRRSFLLGELTSECEHLVKIQ